VGWGFHGNYARHAPLPSARGAFSGEILQARAKEVRRPAYYTKATKFPGSKLSMSKLTGTKFNAKGS
jgi:hypothetical protein